MNFQHLTGRNLNNLSQFHRTAVKINSIVILSGIDWVWNCNQTATITLNQTDTTEINDVYKSPLKSSLHCYITCFSYTLSCKNVPLMKCNLGSLLEGATHFQSQNSFPICNNFFKPRFIKSSHVRFIFRTTLTRQCCHRVLSRTTGCPVCSARCLGLESNLTWLHFIVPVSQSLSLCRTNDRNTCQTCN